MGFYLDIDDVLSVPLASVTGWGDVRRYTKRLPLTRFFNFVQFVEWGESEKLELLTEELKTLLSGRAPASEETTKTLSNLLSVLESRPEDSIIAFVNDGMTPL